MALSWRWIKEKDQVLHQVHHPFSSRLGFHQGYLFISWLRKSVCFMGLGFWQIWRIYWGGHLCVKWCPPNKWQNLLQKVREFMIWTRGNSCKSDDVITVGLHSDSDGYLILETGNWNGDALVAISCKRFRALIGHRPSRIPARFNSFQVLTHSIWR